MIPGLLRNMDSGQIILHNHLLLEDVEAVIWRAPLMLFSDAHSSLGSGQTLAQTATWIIRSESRMLSQVLGHFPTMVDNMRDQLKAIFNANAKATDVGLLQLPEHR